jgi:formate dehydrogenase maturation protein FdhE
MRHGQPYIPTPQSCPRCDSPKIQGMIRPAEHEAESLVTWYECSDCRRMWHVEKIAETKKAHHPPLVR